MSSSNCDATTSSGKETFRADIVRVAVSSNAVSSLLRFVVSFNLCSSEMVFRGEGPSITPANPTSVTASTISSTAAASSARFLSAMVRGRAAKGFS